jgi:hypothetical protein
MPKGVAPRDPARPKKAPPAAFVERQWKPGQSGNPAGRPPGKPYLSDALRRLLEAAPEKLDGIAEVLLLLAMKGDLGAIRELWDRTEGKPQASVRVEGEGLGHATPEDLARALEILEKVRGRKKP